MVEIDMRRNVVLVFGGFFFLYGVELFESIKKMDLSI